MGTPTTKSRSTLVVGLIVLAALLIPISSAFSAAGSVRTRVPAGADKHFGAKGEIDVNACPEQVQPGIVTCFARKRVDSNAKTLIPAREHRSKGTGGKSPDRVSTDTFVGDNGAYSPLYLQSAYNAPSSNPGATVAIVDAYDDSRVESDLAYYRSYFGLSPCTTANGCFRKVDQRGGTSYPQGNNTWATEMSLDVDMVSAICPNCHILVVEADSNSSADLGRAVNEAVALGASAVSMSWGGAEYSAETTEAAAYYDHPGVALVASSGDYGYGPEFPSAAPGVVSVGGTTLSQATDTGTRDATETLWSGTGGGCSAYMPKPSWQHDTGCRNRTMNDVSAVADPNTGVWVWDTYPLGGGWSIFGGTSASAPIIASLYALAGNPSSSTEMPSTLYGAQASSFNDITSGFNGSCTNYLCVAGVGYDGPTGFGTPDNLAPFLLSSAAPAPPSASITSPASGATVSGTTSVQISASSSAGIASVTLAVDGSTAGTDTSSPWTFSVDTTKLSNGIHTLAVTATDTVGGSASAQVTVDVQNVAADTKAPSTPSGVKVAVAGTTQAAIFWSPSSDNTGVAGYYVYRDGVQIAQTSLPNYFDTGLTPGTSHAYTVMSFDAAGNVSSSSSKLNMKTVSTSTSTTGTIAGVVYTAAGKPVANVVVTLTGNGLTKTVKTNNSGVYKFSSLPAGAYTLTIATSVTNPSSSPPGSVTAVAGQTVVLVDGS